eukprot:537436_1
MLPFLILFFGKSIALNPVTCNSVAYEYDGVPYAEPADACHADTVNYYDYSYMYYCDGEAMRQKQWETDSTCTGTPDQDRSWEEIAASTSPPITVYHYNCSLEECEYAQQRVYYPLPQTTVPYCDNWTPTRQDSGHIDEFYIRGYCMDFGTFSEQWACTALNGGAMAYYNHPGVTDCSGPPTLIFSAHKGANQCFNYTTVEDKVYRRKEDWLQCEVATPSPTPKWTQPVTNLPCNAVEFEFAAGKVSYPIDVCIHDKTTQQSLMFTCDDANTLRFSSWDITHECEGTPLNEGTSFQAYIDSQSTIIQAQFGAYEVQCGLEECDYIILRDYTFTGDCASFVPDEGSEYTESYYIKDYCLEIPGEGSIAWGCDDINEHVTEISYFNGVTDCSDIYSAQLDWYDYGKGQCTTGTILNVQK